MSSMPHDELLSANLDGELNAAERAEAERLLATDPAARRLFEELKAMRAAIQALPQEKIGRDIGRQVLGAAERRMLLEDAPKEPAEPLARRILRRATNPHTLIWLSLTAAIVVMIAIHDRQQNQHVAKDADRKVAFSAPRSESSPVSSTPSVSAAPTAAPVLEKVKSDVSLGVRTNSERAKDRVLRDGGATLSESIGAENVRAEKAATVNRPASKSAVAGPATPADERFAGTISSKSSETGIELSFGAGGMKKAAAEGPPTIALGTDADKASVNVSGLASVRNSLDRQRQPQTGVSQAALVVYCDISPEAARTKAFDKLLDANGIKWHRQNANDKNATDFSILARRSSGKPPKEDKPKMAVNQKAELRQENKPRAAVVFDESEKDESKKDAAEDVIYVEATPAQVNAALAGLAAQPDVFLAVSVGTPVGQKAAGGQGAGASKKLQDNRVLTHPARQSPISNLQPPAANAAVTGGTVTQLQTVPSLQSPALQPQTAPTADQRQRQQPVIQKPLQSQLQQNQPQAQLDNLAASRQRVVFVLRVNRLSPEAAKARNRE